MGSLKDKMHAHQARWTKARLLGAACCAAVLVWALRSRAGGSRTIDQLPFTEEGASSKGKARERSTAVWPKTRVISDLETWWEVPEHPRGVLFVAHGCNHGGADFWPHSERCEECTGLPGELIVRRAALEQGYALIAVSSRDRMSKCWSGQDLEPASGLLKTLITEEKLDSLPLYAWGASSGGAFVQQLPAYLPEVKGIVAEIAPADSKVCEAGDEHPHPPILFVHMAERDELTAASVADALKTCKEKGVPADEVRVAPQPVTPEFLQQSPQIDAKLAADIVKALKQSKLIDKSGFLRADPRQSAWRDSLKPVMGDASLQPDVGHLPELLNMAYAQHEIISDNARMWFKWLEAEGKTPVAELPE